tara:strand:+ start:7407 stop:7637 length:231 start_codon:yes stop_codon:yes gene_type:complete
MDYETLIEQAGFHIVSGHRRLQAALGIGHPVLASDGTGEIFRVAMVDGRMTVTPASGEQSGGAMVTVARVNPGKPS